MENGKGMCMPEHVVHICEIFDVPTDYLYFGNKVIGEKSIESTDKINDMLENCSEDDIARIEQLIALFLQK